MAGGHHQLVEPDGVEDPHVARVDDLVPLHGVGERGVGHLHADLVAVLDLIDVPERRQVGGPVTGDRDRARLAGERGVRVVAGPLLQ